MPIRDRACSGKIYTQREARHGPTLDLASFVVAWPTTKPSFQLQRMPNEYSQTGGEAFPMEDRKGLRPPQILPMTLAFYRTITTSMGAKDDISTPEW